ncbi:dihydropteroate synthase [Paenibacillus darwinianus]|uniref:Dihydropteroate synthase n=1 Tax=Paenibacillus darwinianus TaxID=1380763 RepID=A0A9W5S0R8_9BACL|nr:dihydropteroate synthase [Paenibacillus darwinianus]EXX86749.1 dihydropteroate synthase [Paenibacillus darwinianus]EXX87613.1 dihydropteroate synthase [Paenibacillus darwinianus]EXX87651.1 dihydropteroate synthase [Paenibacillus darwinianus]
MRPIIWKRSCELQGGVRLALGDRTLIMGILNVTPDSFSDGGRYDNVAAAVSHARLMAAEGADIIDIGGESTRPGGEQVPLEEELRRVLPVIRAVREALPDMPLSIDTYKAETAQRALEAGAHIINDVWGLQADAGMAAVTAAWGCPIVIGHNRQTAEYGNFVPDVLDDLRRGVETASAAGVAKERVWLDPGIGFAKNCEQNLELLGRLDELVALGYPVLLGTSRKRFIRETLELPPDDVVEGTGATVALGIAQGCQIVRVHDVKAMKRLAAMTDAVVYRRADIRE